MINYFYRSLEGLVYAIYQSPRVQKRLFSFRKNYWKYLFFKHKNTTFHQTFTNEHFLCKSLIFCFFRFTHTLLLFNFSIVWWWFYLNWNSYHYTQNKKFLTNVFFLYFNVWFIEYKIILIFQYIPTLNNKLYGGLSIANIVLCSVCCTGSVFFYWWKYWCCPVFKHTSFSLINRPLL